MSKFYVVCDLGEEAVKSDPVGSLAAAQAVLELNKTQWPNYRFWIMEVNNDQVKIHEDVELEWN